MDKQNMPSEYDLSYLIVAHGLMDVSFPSQSQINAFAYDLLARYGQPAQPAASAEPVRVRDESQPIYLDGVECQYSIEKGDPWPYSETVAYVFEREDAELIAAALNAAPTPPADGQQDQSGYTAADMASQGAQGWRDGYDAARAQQEGT